MIFIKPTVAPSCFGCEWYGDEYVFLIRALNLFTAVITRDNISRALRRLYNFVIPQIVPHVFSLKTGNEIEHQLIVRANQGVSFEESGGNETRMAVSRWYSLNLFIVC